MINKSEAENILNLYKYFVSVNGDMQATYKYFIKHFEGKGQDALSNYLKETAYIGKYKLYRQDIYIDNYIPAIVDLDLWNQVQNLRHKKTIKKGSPISDKFSGLIYCYGCKNRMSKKVDNRTKIKKVRYVCDNNYKYEVGTNIRKCKDSNIIREDHIESYLLNNICKDLQKEKQKLKVLVTDQSIKNDSTDKIKILESKINKLKDLYLDDLIDKEIYKKDYEKYNNQLVELKKYNIRHEEVKDFSHIEKILNSDYQTIYNKLSVENKKQFWLSIIDKIYVEKGEIKEVTFL